MKKRLPLVIFVVCIFLLCACNGNHTNNAHQSSNESTIETVSKFPFTGEWKAKVLISNLGSVEKYSISVITLNADGTGTYKDKNGTWVYHEDEKKISLTLAEGIGGLTIGEENGKTILKFFQDTYYRAEEFVE